MRKNNPQKVIAEFKKRNITLSCAESFTGGLFASTLVSIPGCSAVFKGGVTTYSSESKIKILGVKKETIDKFDVVSKEVAIEMANRIRKKLNTDVAVSFTGNAGPTKENGNAPVGTCYIAISTKNKTEVYKKIFKLDREKIRINAVDFVLEKISSKNFLVKFQNFAK